MGKEKCFDKIKELYGVVNQNITELSNDLIPIKEKIKDILVYLKDEEKNK